MPAARDLLFKLLEYIGEQAKDIDPRGFRLEAHKYFLKRREDIAGLPGVEFDLKIAGDHIWLRVPRLEASSPPPYFFSGKLFPLMNYSFPYAGTLEMPQPGLDY
jgi:hypothetical protein